MTQTDDGKAEQTMNRIRMW